MLKRFTPQSLEPKEPDNHPVKALTHKFVKTRKISQKSFTQTCEKHPSRVFPQRIKGEPQPLKKLSTNLLTPQVPYLAIIRSSDNFLESPITSFVHIGRINSLDYLVTLRWIIGTSQSVNRQNPSSSAFHRKILT